MDPTQNLKEIRELCGAFERTPQECSANDAVRLAELVDALDDWICRGGFLPRQWQQKAKV
jgi:hypothetical protein